MGSQSDKYPFSLNFIEYKIFKWIHKIWVRRSKKTGPWLSAAYQSQCGQREAWKQDV